jgi:hypothetical protein
MTEQKFLQEDIEFLDSLNTSPVPESNIGMTAERGYIRELERPELQHLENIYKKMIDPSFSLCFWCKNDVLKMVQKIYAKLAAERAQDDAQAEFDRLQAEEQAERDAQAQKDAEAEAAKLAAERADQDATGAPAPADQEQEPRSPLADIADDIRNGTFVGVPPASPAEEKPATETVPPADQTPPAPKPKPGRKPAAPKEGQ